MFHGDFVLLPEEKNAHTLASAARVIGRYLDEKMSKVKVPAEEQVFLNQILNQINAINSTQRGWLKIGGLTTDAVARGKVDYTQEELLKEAEETQKKTLGFTYLSVKQLKKQLEAFKQQQENFAKFPELMAYMEQCMDTILENIDNQAKIVTEVITVKLKPAETLPKEEIKQTQPSDKMVTKEVLTVKSVEIRPPVIEILIKAKKALEAENRKIETTTRKRLIQEFQNQIDLLNEFFEKWKNPDTKNNEDKKQTESEKEFDKLKERSPHIAIWLNAEFLQEVLKSVNFLRSEFASKQPGLLGQFQSHFNRIVNSIKTRAEILSEDPPELKLKSTSSNELPPNEPLSLQQYLKIFTSKEAGGVGGRYIPFVQRYDPLYGDEKGVCFGHTITWSRAVVAASRTIKEAQEFEKAEELKNPKEPHTPLPRMDPISLPRLDEATSRLQETQKDFKAEEVFKNEYKTFDDFVSAFNKVLDAMTDPNRVYFLEHYTNIKEDGHAMAIRIAPVLKSDKDEKAVQDSKNSLENKVSPVGKGSQEEAPQKEKVPPSFEIEFFEPNLGVLVFDKNSKEGRALLAHYLFHCYTDDLQNLKQGSLSLKEALTIPEDLRENVAVSVPVFVSPHPQAKKVSNGAGIYQSLGIDPRVTKREEQVAALSDEKSATSRSKVAQQQISQQQDSQQTSVKEVKVSTGNLKMR